MIIGLTAKDEEVTKPTQTFKEAAKEEFMSECVSDGLYNYCNCSFETMYNKLGANGFIDLSAEYDETQVLPEEVFDMIMPCFDLIEE